MKIRNGYASVFVLIHAFSVFLLATGLFFKISALKKSVLSDSEYVLKSEEMQNIIHEFLKQSTFSDFYEREFKKDNVLLKIKSLNTKVNPNFLDDDYLTVFTDARDFDPFKRKNAEGSFYDFSEIKTEADYSEFFSNLPSVNINLCNQTLLEEFMKIMKTEPLFILEKITNMRKKKQQIQNEDFLEEILGLYHDALFPFLNCVPPVDVRYADEKILKKIMQVEKFGTKNALLYEELLSLRNQGGNIEPQFLKLLSRFDSKAVKLLGCRTYFWKITAFNERFSVSETVYVPQIQGGHKYLIEKKAGKNE